MPEPCQRCSKAHGPLMLSWNGGAWKSWQGGYRLDRGRFGEDTARVFCVPCFRVAFPKTSVTALGEKHETPAFDETQERA